MKDIQPIRGKFYIHGLIQEGEHEHQDFKFAISDAVKIAHSISAFANNDGGRLLIGVKDNGRISGVRSEEDIYLVEQAAHMYCRPEVDISVTAFACEGGAVVVRVDIPKAVDRPVYARTEQGDWCAYFRVKDENIVAHPVMVHAWERMRADEELVFSLSDYESRMLSHLKESGMMSIEDYIRASHMSRSASEDLISRLYRLGLVEFVYTGTGFMIVKS